MKSNIYYIVLITSVFTVSCFKGSGISFQKEIVPVAMVFQPDEINGEDAIIASSTPDSNYGNSEHFMLFSNNNSGLYDTCRTLLKFDLSEFPSQTNITSAKLSLFYFRHDDFIGHMGANAFTIYQITELWGEDNVTWNNQPSISNIDSVAVSESLTTSQSYLDIDVTKLVRQMISNPDRNYGWVLKLDDEFPYKSVVLASSDCLNENKRPKLVVYY